MKKLLLASAIAALSVSAANAAPTVYGKAGVDFNYAEDGDVTLDSNSTRIGVKGEENLTNYTDVVYKLEFAVDIDGDKVGLANRDTYVGLKNDGFGEVRAGRNLSVEEYVNYTNPSDYFNSGLNGYDAGRYSNNIVYMTPDYSGLQFLAMYNFTASESGNEAADDDGAFAVAAKYEGEGFNLGAAYADDTGVESAMRVSGSLDFGQATLSGLYQIADYDTDDDENSIIVAAEYDLMNSPWAVYAEYDALTNFEGNEDADVNIISTGATYKFSDAAVGRVYLGYDDFDGDDNDSFGFGTGMTYSF